MANKKFTILTQTGGRNVALVSKAAEASTAKPTFTSSQFETDEDLAHRLNDLVSYVEDRTEVPIDCPINSGVIVQGVALSAGVTTSIQHTLGRAYIGWFCVRALTAAFSAFEIVGTATLPGDRYLTLRSNNTGTYDILVF